MTPVRLLVLLAVLLAAPASAQRSVAAYTPAQQAALQEFLAGVSMLRFLPESRFNAETLRYARLEWGFGARFTPYYQRGDIDGDGDMDFAAVLFHPGQGSLFAAVFVQIPGQTYRIAHVEPLGPFNDALFVQIARGRLHYGVMESDDCGEFAPSGEGFVVVDCS